MGPLVPDIISSNLNLILAIIIGMLFGAILEQAGFSTSKKLVGLFYGYDFTVLRVFFTGGVTAMIGVIAFEHFGLLDMSLVYVNPTFLWSAIVGGLIMGLGFVIGGFCPGTSIVAAAIGKIDAMLFVAGSFIGVLIFAEGYPLFEGLYKAANWGSPRIFESLGMPQTIFAFLLVAVALGAFWMVGIIENKVNKNPQPAFNFSKYYVTLAAIGGIMAVSAFMFPIRKDSVVSKADDINYVKSFNVNYMTSDELALRLIKNDKNIQLLDFRAPSEYKKMSLPKSTSFTIDNLFEKEPNQILSVRGKTNVIIADNEIMERKLAIIFDELGYENYFILKGGLNQFKEEIINYNPDNQNLNADTKRFRTKAAVVIPELIKNNKSTGPVQKTQKRVVGGC
ncbi:MAG TPA: YeeE/YedE thiosulfate transporter family protein [Ignavibacteriaceae bacterium]|nr:YeeE/YedE thiosulfate transporter family protein [Ignavibacteriaceae bacterium]